MAKSERFQFIKKDSGSLGIGSTVEILVDRKTGVNYLYVGSGYGGGLTPLLDQEGKPIVTDIGTLEE